MRTFLSHDATAKCSDTGENERSDMLSSGGAVKATSLEISPSVALELELEEAVPKRPDMIDWR